jgi:O-antigen biosynthesis protein WbqP
VTLYERIGKRALDVVMSGVGIVVLSPVLVFIAAAIAITDPGPVIFRQRRVGRDGADFVLLKFRSMRVGTGDIPSAAARHLPITPIGRFLRRTNLDEMPQMFNILRGDMSVVGPRPALPGQGDLVELRRGNGAIRARPGLTGLAQVSAFDGMPVSVKAELDGKYVGRITFAGDLAIMARTVTYLLHPPPVY